VVDRFGGEIPRAQTRSFPEGDRVAECDEAESDTGTAAAAEDDASQVDDEAQESRHTHGRSRRRR